MTTKSKPEVSSRSWGQRLDSNRLCLFFPPQIPLTKCQMEIGSLEIISVFIPQDIMHRVENHLTLPKYSLEPLISPPAAIAMQGGVWSPCSQWLLFFFMDIGKEGLTWRIFQNINNWNKKCVPEVHVPLGGKHCQAQFLINAFTLNQQPGNNSHLIA